MWGGILEGIGPDRYIIGPGLIELPFAGGPPRLFILLFGVAAELLPPLGGGVAGGYEEGGILEPEEEGVFEGVELLLEARKGSIGGASLKSIICTGGGLMHRGCVSSGGGEPGGGDGGGMLSSSGSTCSLSSKSISGSFNLSIRRFRPVALSVRFRRSFLRCLEAVNFAGDLNASAPDDDDSSPGATPSAKRTVFLATHEPVFVRRMLRS